MNRLVVGLVVGLVAGLAVGVMVGGYGAEGDDELASSAGPSSSGSSDRDSGSSPAPAPEVAARRNAEVAPPPATPALRDAVSSIRVPAPEVGSERVFGVVATADGTPVGGVTVRVERVDLAEQEVVVNPQDVPVEEIVARYAHRLRWRRSTRREAVTDGDGAFDVGGLPDGRFSLGFQATGYRFVRRGGGRLHRIVPGHADVLAKEVCELTADVRLPNGEAPRAATLRFNGAERQRLLWRPEQPVVAPEPGRYRVSVEAGEDEEFHIEPFDVSLTAGVREEPLVLQLVASRMIRGRVVVPPEQGTVDLSVRALPVVGGRAPTAATLLEEGQRDRVRAWTGYSFAFGRDIVAGRYALAAFMDDVPASDVVTVDVTDGPASCNITLKPMERGDQLEIWAYGPEGKLLNRIRARVGAKTDGSEERDSRSPVRRPDGAFVVAHHEDAEKADATFVDVACALGTIRAEYPFGAGASVTVRFVAPARLEVIVVGLAGSTLRGRVRPKLERKQDTDGRSIREGSAQATADDVWRFEGMQPGEYVLTLETGSRRGWRLHREELSLASGDNRVTVPLPTLHDVEVTFPDGRTDVEATLRSEDRRDWRQRQRKKTDDAGRVRFEGIPAGTYVVSVRSRGMSEAMTIVVPRDTSVTFSAAVVNALKVFVDDAGGYLAQVGFESGDVIIGIDGKEFENQQQLMTAFVSFRSKENVTFTVQRGTRTFDVAVDVAKFVDRRRVGGRVEPGSR